MTNNKFWIGYQEKFKTLLNKWVVPISKDLTKSEALLVAKSYKDYKNYVRLAYIGNSKWIVLRKLTKEDAKSLDFMKYIISFRINKIKRKEKLK